MIRFNPLLPISPLPTKRPPPQDLLDVRSVLSLYKRKSFSMSAQSIPSFQLKLILLFVFKNYPLKKIAFNKRPS